MELVDRAGGGRSFREGSGGHSVLRSRSTLVVAVYGALALVAVAWGLGQGRLDIYHLPGVQPAEWRLLVSPLVGAVFGLVVVGASRLAVRRFDWARTLHVEFRTLLGPMSDREVLVIALASSIGEEALFRGAALPATGLIVSTVVFAALHVAPSPRLFVRMLPWTASALVIGLGLGGLYLLVGDLGAPIAAHFVINYLNLRHINQHDLPPVAAGRT
jgi:hypothetical protein